VRDILFLTVADDTMLREASVEVMIMARLVGDDPRLLGNVLLQYRHDGRGLQIVNDNRPRLTRDEAVAAHRGEFARAHCLRNAIRDEPRRCVSDL
jgi:hypothetical protein